MTENVLTKPALIRKRLKQSEQRLHELRSVGAHAIRYDLTGARHDKYNNSDPTGEHAVRLAEAEEHHAALVGEYITALDDLEELIDRMFTEGKLTPLEQLVLYDKLIRNMTGAEIAAAINKSKQYVFDLMASGQKKIRKEVEG